MDPNVPPLTEPHEEDSPQVAKKESHVAIIVLVVLTLTVILAGILFLFFFLRSHKDLLTVAVATNQSNTTEATQDTITASSLDVPQLYSQADWQAVPADSHDNSLATLIYSISNTQVILNGKYWTTEIENDTSMNIDSYYFDALKKEGWFGAGGPGTLQFADFSLTPPAAGGPCGGIHSFLGYEGGSVRLVSVLGEKVPCQQASSVYTTPATDYTVFVSDPMKLSDIQKYIKSQG